MYNTFFSVLDALGRMYNTFFYLDVLVRINSSHNCPSKSVLGMRANRVHGDYNESNDPATYASGHFFSTLRS